jgi:hypothetical protein
MKGVDLLLGALHEAQDRGQEMPCSSGVLRGSSWEASAADLARVAPKARNDMATRMREWFIGKG